MKYIVLSLMVLLATAQPAFSQSDGTKEILGELARLRSDVTTLQADLGKLDGRVSDLEASRPVAKAVSRLAAPFRVAAQQPVVRQQPAVQQQAVIRPQQPALRLQQSRASGACSS